MKQSLWALAAAALFSVMAAFVKLCSDVHGPIEMVFYRSLFGVLVISLFVFRNRATLTLKTPHIAGHIKRSVLGTLSIMLWFFTLGKMHFGTNMTLIYTTPLFMAANFVILALMRHKPAPWALVLATIAGFTGVTIVLQPSFNEGELIPALICLGVSLLDLVIYWQMKELGDMKEPSWRIVFYFTLFGTIAGLIACYVVEGGLHMPNAQGLVGILGMGLCATLGQICTTRSYAYGNMLLSSCLGFSAIPFSVIISFFWFGESVTAATLTGAAVILCSGMMATVATKRTEAAEKAAYEAKAGHPVHDFYWFTDLYKQMPFGNPAYHELFRLLEEHRVPLLFHCTCGKDRTGIAAMLVLLALGVSREDAIADYMLTNVYRKAIIDKFMQDKPADQYDLLLPVEGVSESMGAGSIDVLLEKYPSYEAYFEAEYGLTTARLAALRDFYLE